jgi:pyridinium-3,5-biscarboxylic acid mononucleotide sulfurtransferase
LADFAIFLAPFAVRAFNRKGQKITNDTPPSPRSAKINNSSMPLSADLTAKRVALERAICGLGRTLIAYSGGVDSALLAWTAHQVLGSDMLAVIADSPSLARSQLADAVAFARECDIPLQIITTNELDRPEYARNDGSRCYFCKDELFTILEDFRQSRGFASIAYGVNTDDQADFRPGQIAASQHHVVAPLLQAALRKEDIRQLARDAGLRIWDKPASACLSSRIEYGRPVTRESLSVIEQGEDALRALGFRQFRVRHHGDIVRIEIAPDEMSRAQSADMAAEFTRIFKELGFKFVTLDLEGFRSGSMNALLPADQLSHKLNS